jgi:hypothetical protein
VGDNNMKIRMLTNFPRGSGGHYREGEVYEFANDVARRWIERGRAEEVKERREPRPKTEKEED